VLDAYRHNNPARARKLVFDGLEVRAQIAEADWAD
jgi:hypothetical protein